MSRNYQYMTPNGGWGFVLVVASFLNLIIIDACMYSFGLIIFDLQTYFNSSISEIGLIICCMFTFHFLTASSVAILIDYGVNYRFVGLIGAALASVSFGICSWFCIHYLFMLFLIGICAGMGLGTSFAISNIVIVLYFKDFSILSSGVASGATGFGLLIILPIIKYTTNDCDWQVKLWILSIFLMGTCVTSITYIGLKRKENNPQKSENVTVNVKLHVTSKLVENTYEPVENVNIRNLDPENPHIPMNFTIAEDDRFGMDNRYLKQINLSTIMVNFFRQKLLKSTSFHLYNYSCILFMSGYLIPMIYIFSYAISIDIDSLHAFWFLPMIGASNIMGRLFASIIRAVYGSNLLIYIEVVFLLIGVFTILFGCNFYLTYKLQMLYVTLFGFSTSCFCLFPMLTMELFDIQEFTIAFSIQMFSMSIGALGGLIISVLILYRTNNFLFIFCTSGIQMITSAILLILSKQFKGIK